MGHLHAQAALYPREIPGTHCTGGWEGHRAGLDRCGKPRPTEIRSPDRPARSQSLYRLRHPANAQHYDVLKCHAVRTKYVCVKITSNLEPLHSQYFVDNNFYSSWFVLNISACYYYPGNRVMVVDHGVSTVR